MKKRDYPANDYRAIGLKPGVWLILGPEGWVEGECASAEEALVELERLRALRGRKGSA